MWLQRFARVHLWRGSPGSPRQERSRQPATFSPAHMPPTAGGMCDGILDAMRHARWDPFAATASALALTMLVVYLWVIGQQQEEGPAVWAVAALIVGAAAAGLGAIVAFPYRGAALVTAAVVLIGLGLLAILTIGLPILVAGSLCVIAGWRSRPAPDE